MGTNCSVEVVAPEPKNNAGLPAELPASGGAFQFLCLFFFSVLAACSPPPPTETSFSGGDVERGEKVAALAGGCGCHTEKAGPLLAGGKALVTPAGTFFSTNITSDSTYGVGAWSDSEIEQGIRGGVLPDGSIEAPAMPYYRYAGMSDEDVRDLIAWLRTVPPADRKNRPAESPIPAQRLVWRVWQAIFAPAVVAPREVPPGHPDRGRYLTEHVAICGDCHTPRTIFGTPDAGLYLAGGNDVGETVPNITPDKQTGIGDWDLEDIVASLEMGMLPNLDSVQGLMEEVVDGVSGGPGYGAADPEDLLAISQYIRSIPAVSHTPE
jgi:mono/diheme cytochrome c family protein